MDGRWNLEVATPFGKHPATLVIERERGGSLSGHIASRLGNARLSDINPTGDGFNAVVSLELQGRTYDAKVSASIENERMEGSIHVNIPMVPPARFTGTKD